MKKMFSKWISVGMAAMVAVCALMMPASAAEIFPLQAYTEDQPMGIFVKSPFIDVEVDGESFQIKGNNPQANGEPNIVFYVTRAQLEATPYLILDIANSGDPEVGPLFHVRGQWVNDTLNTPKFYHSARANGMTGLTCIDLLTTMKLVGDDPSGMNIHIHHVNHPYDDTSKQPLVFNKIYLTSEPIENTWEEKEDTPVESTPVESTPAESTPEVSTPEESTPAESTPEESTPAESTPTESTPATESKPENESQAASDAGTGSSDPADPTGLIVTLVIVAVVVAAGVVVLVIVLKKKKNAA